MVRLPDNNRRVLARLSDVTQELTVGIANASATVRTLTGVSLEVRERELVVLSGSPGAGERAVISVLAGDRRGVTGSCDVNADTRVRLFRIGSRAAIALIQEWQRCDMLAYCAAMVHAEDNTGATTSPTLHPEIRRNAELHALMQQVPAPNVPPDLILLDVVRDVGDASSAMSNHRDGIHPARRVAEGVPSGLAPWDERNRAALTAWAGVCRMRGGAVVVAAGNAIGSDIFDSALRRMSGATTPSAVRETFTEGAGVRVVPMHSGRLGAPVQLRIGEMLS
jgi:energy-coupling factor transporter ATP-binding protein EcfA2